MIDYVYLERLRKELFEDPEQRNTVHVINALTDQREKFILHVMFYVDTRFYNPNYVDLTVSEDLTKLYINSPRTDVHLKTIPAKER